MEKFTQRLNLTVIPYAILDYGEDTKIIGSDFDTTFEIAANAKRIVDGRLGGSDFQWLSFGAEPKCAFNGGDGVPINQKIISSDSSILNNPKGKCALEKLLGKNVKFDSLLKAFTGTGYNLKFAIKDALINTKPSNDPRGETVFDPNNPSNIQINLKRSFVNRAKPIEIAKTLLHEAFHANLIQRAYEVFGNNNISTWTKGPKNMELNELIDIFEAKLGGTNTIDTHHAYMAKNVAVLAKGLEQFAKDYDTNYSNNNYYDYLALAYQGLTENEYFEKNIKNTKIYYFPGLDVSMSADSLISNKGNRTKSDSNVNCN